MKPLNPNSQAQTPSTRQPMNAMEPELLHFACLPLAGSTEHGRKNVQTNAAQLFAEYHLLRLVSRETTDHKYLFSYDADVIYV